MAIPQRRVVRLDASTEALFWALHCPARLALDAGWCCCVAWHVQSFDGWAERSFDQNRVLREALFDAGRHDGYLVVDGGETLAWCQVAPRDELPNLRRRYGLASEPGTLAIGCFLVAPGRRREGLATELLRGVLADLHARGVKRLEAYPKRSLASDRSADAAAEEGDLWTGPESLFLAEGFRITREDERLPILSLELT